MIIKDEKLSNGLLAIFSQCEVVKQKLLISIDKVSVQSTADSGRRKAADDRIVNKFFDYRSPEYERDQANLGELSVGNA